MSTHSAGAPDRTRSEEAVPGGDVGGDDRSRQPSSASGWAASQPEAFASPVNGSPDYSADSRGKLLSAVAAFSDLVSSPTRFTPDSTPTRDVARKVVEWCPPSPHSLPTEILRMIFQFVFESCLGSEDNVDGDSPATWLVEDPLSPSLFPYSFACVCFRWFRILRTIPVYWTRLVVPLDTIVASLHASRIVLKWAGSRPLHVIVTRHHSASQGHDSERLAVGRAMRLLRTHIGHIQSLSFDVEHNCSIPALWRESGQASHLTTLTLLSHSDAGHLSPLLQGLSAGNGREYEGKLKVPELQRVAFSLAFFKHALMDHPRLASWFTHVTSLVIFGDAGGTAISLYKFLSVLDMFASIRQLTVEDIHFDDNAPYPNLLMLRPAALCLRKITGKTALRSILTRPRIGSSRGADISIIDCEVHGFRDPDPGSSLQFSSTNLTLASMNPTATIDDLVCRWNGESLAVIDCPKMSRSFLDRLHGEAAPMHLSRLEIVDCDNFNVGDLISLVRSRETQAGFVSLMGASDDDSFTALAELRVRGRGPPMSVKRARWMADHVDTFVWNTVAKNGFRYAWDGSAGEVVVSPASSTVKLLPAGN